MHLYDGLILLNILVKYVSCFYLDIFLDAINCNTDDDFLIKSCALLRELNLSMIISQKNEIMSIISKKSIELFYMQFFL